MPSYSYRCLHCQQIDTVVQSIQDTFAPPCSICGGLTERYIGQAPTMLKSTPESAEQSHTSSAPEFPSTCAMHHRHIHGPGCRHS